MKEKKKYKIGGMSCAACIRTVEKSIDKIEGVKQVQINLATNMATVEFDPSVCTDQEIVKAVKNAGYEVLSENLEQNLSEKENFYLKDKKNMIYSWILTAPMMLLMFVGMLVNLEKQSQYIHYLSQILALVIIFFPARQVFISAFKSISHFNANMDVLIALGSGSALITGLLNIGSISHGFTEISSMILAIHLTGRFIERKAKGKTSQAIRKLMEMGAKEALVLIGDNWEKRAVSDLTIGQIMMVKPGEKVPTDGIVIEGESYIDESIATGESIAVFKTIGSSVIGATINSSGNLKVEIQKVGKETFLSRMIQLVEDAQSTKVPIQAFADKITGIFVPMVIMFAVIAFFVHLFWGEQIINLLMSINLHLPWVHQHNSPLEQAIFVMISVLVIACPCALGLATPTAIMAGMGIGAKFGILFRNGEAIQTISESKMIVFDKTGTLTLGKPVVTDIFAVEGITEETIIKTAYTLESQSEHPLSFAIEQKAKEMGLILLKSTNFKNFSGKGITGKVDDKQYFVGSELFLTENNVSFGQYQDKIDERRSQGKTLILLSQENEFLGFIALMDQVKDHAKELISILKKKQIKTVLLSGDNERTVKETGKILDIDQVTGGVLPDQKSQKIKELQEQGHRVIMVGDGINDAPALKQSDISIAMGHGTDIAMEVSDIVIINGDPLSIIKTINLSKEIFKVIKQNLFWAFFYNLIAIPFAFAGLLHPIIAETAMAISSITVVLNANRLRNIDLNIKGKTMTKLRLKVEDMVCNHCKLRISKTIEALNGVNSIHIDLEEKQVWIEYNEQIIQSEKIKSCIISLGYHVERME